LSCFDGNHVYLFKAKVNDNSQQLTGGFWSGKAGYENWTAVKDDKAALPDANTLTFLKPGYERLDFTFPDADGKSVSLQDERFKGKVVIVQIMGSWCPNCMDETNFLSPWYKKNRERGVEIIGLAYERNPDFAVSAPKIKRLMNRFDIDYPVLFAGQNDKAKASLTLPMLNRVVAFPTTIFIDKQGKVRKIHTGFSGPGTGEYYTRFVEEFEQFTDKLIAEPVTDKTAMK
jgi:thiol-disulfide isomerase/thioredoxin